ncbi:MAG: NAD(P)H-dependent glycerol-3-phosphate dehydrogenase [Thermosynechococcaceae cyanobacterium]
MTIQRSVNTAKCEGNATILTILGGGLWGSALATLGRKNGHTVRIWSRQGNQSLAQAVEDADAILIAVAMKGVQETAERLKGVALDRSTILVSATKGLDPDTWQTPSQIWQAQFPNHPIAVLSGPNLSKEIEQGLPAATVIASEPDEAATDVQGLLASDSFRIYTNADRLGTELGGTLKNVVAIAVGVCDGLHLGQNARAALITRALPEMIRVGVRLGGQRETFYGLSGLGDLLATCTSPLSRNYQVGYQLAQGKALDEILTHLPGTAEGVNTTHVLMQLAAQHHLSVPIAQQVDRLLRGLITPQEAVEALMERDLKPEVQSSPAMQT